MALTYMKDKLPEFSGNNFQDFIERAKAFFYDQDSAGGNDRTLWNSLQDGDPRKSGPTKTTTHVEVQELRLYPSQGDFLDGQVMRDGRGDLVYDLREQVVQEVEDAQDYLARCQNWDKDMGRVWRFLKRCAVEEAAVLLRSIQDHDGFGAWTTWCSRWGNISMAATIRILEQILEYKQAKHSTQEHITGWCELIRKLSLHKITLLPELESILFLKTLDPTFSAFVTDHKLRPDALKMPSQVYTVARAWKAEKDGKDEADNSQVALWAGGGGGGESSSRGTKRAKVSCFNCDGDHFVRDCPNPCGFCNFKGHTKRECNKRKQAAAAQGKGGGGRGGGGRGGRGGRYGRAGQKDRQPDTRFQAMFVESAANQTKLLERVEEQHVQLNAMKQMAKDAGLEMAFMAEEIGDQEEDFEALECVSLLNTVVLKVDSGASKHFLAGDVHLRDEKPSHVSVQTASKDGVMAMDVNGTLEGTVAGTSGDVGLMLNAEKSDEMAHSLFSVREAVRAGHSVSFTPNGSFIECSDGSRIRLRDTRSGWELHVSNTRSETALDATISPQNGARA